jgi:hypothetical protein
MSIDIIKQKIKNGEGFIEMENAGIVRVTEMSPKDKVTRVFRPDEYKIENDTLELKTDKDKDEETIREAVKRVYRKVAGLKAEKLFIEQEMPNIQNQKIVGLLTELVEDIDQEIDDTKLELQALKKN